MVVFTAWTATRALTAVVLTVAGSREAPSIDTTRLLIWDGGWYRHIMVNGYGERPAVWPPGIGGWTTFPFFPLYPAAAGLLNDIGVPVTAALTAVPNLALLAAMFAVYRLAELQENRAVAVRSVWICALLPGALTFTMAYPDAVFLAASAWAVLWASVQRPALAGLAAAVAAATRPNGALVVVTLVVLLVSGFDGAVARQRTGRTIAWYVAPSATFLAAWMLFLHHQAGDALAFITAKQAWDEDTLLDTLTSPSRQNLSQLFVGAIAIAVVVASRRRQPVAWTVHALLVIVPALALGVVGLIRYSAQAFPVPVGLAAIATHRGLRAVAVTIGACVVLIVTYGILVTHHSHIP